MSYADPTTRMIEFWTGDELEEFAAKAQIVAFPTGFDMTEEDNATRLRNATLKISTRSSINTPSMRPGESAPTSPTSRSSTG